MTRRIAVAALAAAFTGVASVGYGIPRAAWGQVSVSSPYLDIVARYQSGDQSKAVADMSAYPTAGLRDRARKDLRDLTCQVLCGTADCRQARAEKPAEFERVLEAWAASMPAAAALHVDTAIQAQAEDRRDVAEAHRQIALGARRPDGDGAGPRPLRPARPRSRGRGSPTGPCSMVRRRPVPTPKSPGGPRRASW